MFLYQLVGGVAALVASFAIDMMAWGGPFLSIGVAFVLAMLFGSSLDNFYAWLFSGTPDPERERTVARLDRGFLMFHFWWKRRPVVFRRRLRALFGLGKFNAFIRLSHARCDLRRFGRPEGLHFGGHLRRHVAQPYDLIRLSPPDILSAPPKVQRRSH